jgi:hypothetical protein
MVAVFHGSIGRAVTLAGDPTRARRSIMTDRAAEIAYLQDKARQFRVLADEYSTRMSPRLREIADELEARAAELATAKW